MLPYVCVLSRSCVTILKQNKPVANKFQVFNRFNAFQSRASRPQRPQMPYGKVKTEENLASRDITKSWVPIAAGSGLAGLCLYGLISGNSSSNLSAMDQSIYWPQYVKDRIHSTYLYLAGSTAICATVATQLSKNMLFVSKLSTGMAAPLLMMAVSIGCGIVCRSIPYPIDNNYFNAKHAAWLVYSASLGAMIAPICLVGGPILTQAAMYTGAIVGGLSLVGACAPSEKFLNMGGPLAIGLGVVVVSSLGSMFASPIGRLGMGLHAISLYGGLALFSGFLLYDTQKIIYRAKHQNGAMVIYDPINNSINVLLDSINIFVRLVQILNNRSSRK